MKRFTYQFLFAPAEFVETNEQIQDESTGKNTHSHTQYDMRFVNLFTDWTELKHVLCCSDPEQTDL